MILRKNIQHSWEMRWASPSTPTSWRMMSWMDLIVEDLAPRGILGRAAAMALVDHDEVEEIWGEFAIQFLALLGTGDGLIERDVDFVGRIDAPMLLIDRR